MIAVEKALKIVLRNIKRIGAETVGLTDSLNRVLAEDVYACMSIPSFDNSAMDGYAVRARDTAGSSGEKTKTLEVLEVVLAGFIPKKTVESGQAIRIMTGAPIPRGADSVVMVEHTRKIKNQKLKITSQATKEFIEVYKQATPGENIRERGEDIKRGERVLRKGALLKSAHIGMLASLGISKIKVAKRPRIAVLATGDELLDVRQRLAPGKIYSSNTYSLYNQVLACGGVPKSLGIARDNRRDLKTRIRKGLDCDIIITSGGVSVGDYDLVRPVLAEMGGRIGFWKVAMRPGKPVLFGLIRGIPVFGLPGNAVSSMVTFEIFVRPAILKMLGRKLEYGNDARARLEEDITKKRCFKYFLRARTRWEGGTYVTRTTGAQGSGILKSMALANSLIILPEEKARVKKGEMVSVRFLN